MISEEIAYIVHKPWSQQRLVLSLNKPKDVQGQLYKISIGEKTQTIERLAMISEETLDKARIAMTTSSLRGDRLQNIIDVLLASGEVVLRSTTMESKRK